MKLAEADAAFLTEFEAGRWPLAEWHHQQHIQLAYLYLCLYEFPAALERARTMIKQHNAVHQLPEGPDRGYHDTVTVAWLHLVQHTLQAYGPAESAAAFWEQHPELSQKKTLRLFYSKDRIMSPAAKANFLPPDLTDFPQLKS